MATPNLHVASDAATPSFADELRTCVIYASELEDALRHAQHVLTAIDRGELLATAPTDPGDYDKHAAAIGLLDLFGRELTALEKAPRTDLSVKLSCLESRVRAA